MSSCVFRRSASWRGRWGVRELATCDGSPASSGRRCGSTKRYMVAYGRRYEVATVQRTATQDDGLWSGGEQGAHILVIRLPGRGSKSTRPTPKTARAARCCLVRKPHRAALIGTEVQLFCAGPTVSAIVAWRAPIGFGAPSVVSRAVWCSISASSSAPSKITIAESQIQVMNPITAPSDP